MGSNVSDPRRAQANYSRTATLLARAHTPDSARLLRALEMVS